MIRLKLFLNDSDHCVYETHVARAQYGRSLNKSVEWSVAIPLTPEAYAILLSGTRAELWDDLRYLVGGKIKTDDIKFDLDAMIEIRGFEEIDTLYDAPSDSTLYVNNKLFILTLFTLLDRYGWRFGEYRDLSKVYLITKDFRESGDQLLAQFAAVLQLDPELQYRYGGSDYLGQHMIDISTFERSTVHTLQTPSSRSVVEDVVIDNIAVKDDFSKKLYALEAVGGNVQDASSVKRTIRLSDAISANPALALDPLYPIYEEFTELVYVVLPTVEGAIGGRVQSVPAATTTVIAMGSSNASENFWSAFIFHPYPGNLTEVSFWGGNITPTLETAIRSGANPMLWEVREVDESNVLATNGTLLGSGTVDNAAWATNSRCRIIFPTAMPVVGTKRYMFRVGLTSVAAVANTFSVRTSATNLAKTFRFDRSITQAGSSAALNHQPLFEALTVGTATPNGRRTKKTQSEFAPQKEGSNATASDIQNAGLSLYNWAVTYLRSFSVNPHELSVTNAGYATNWQPGDRVQVRAKMQYETFAQDVWETKRIEAIDYVFQDHTEKMTVKFLPTGIDTEIADDVVEAYVQQRAKRQTPEGKIIDPPYAWEMTELTVSIANRVPDTTMSDGTPAITVVFTVPAAPAGKGETRIVGTPYAVHSNPDTRVVSELILKPPTALVCLFAIENRAGWRLSDTATAYAHIVWR